MTLKPVGSSLDKVPVSVRLPVELVRCDHNPTGISGCIAAIAKQVEKKKSNHRMLHNLVTLAEAVSRIGTRICEIKDSTQWQDGGLWLKLKQEFLAEVDGGFST